MNKNKVQQSGIKSQQTQNNANPKNTFTVGHNKFSTWTDDEYSRLLAWRPSGIPNNGDYHVAS